MPAAPTRLATIDCGTNTVLMLVADVVRATGTGGRHLHAVEDRLAITRLGQGLDRTGSLAPEAMERTLRALADHAARARALGASRIVAVGTESLRAAKNGADFLAAAAAPPIGVPLRIISGDDEARLSWRAVAGGLPLPPGGRRSVLDIGGGSTELIVGGAQAERWRSVPIGTVRLTERLLHHDPPAPEEQQALSAAVENALDDLPRPEGELVGLAGTVTTLGAMHLRLAEYDGARVDGMRLPVAALEDLTRLLARTDLAERRRMPGLDPRRADVIYAGAVILSAVAVRAGVDAITISDRGVRWGVLEELADELSDKGDP